MDRTEVLAILASRRQLPRILRQRAIVEGLLSGRKTWLVAGAVLWGIHGVRRAGKRQEQVLLREVLQPGQTLLVREAITRPTRKQQRKIAKAG